jgi:hypothetical protein
MIYFSAVLFMAALAGWGWMVFGNHMTARNRRKEICSTGNHRYTKPMEWLSLDGTHHTGTHCRDCGHWKTWKTQ